MDMYFEEYVTDNYINQTAATYLFLGQIPSGMWISFYVFLGLRK